MAAAALEPTPWFDALLEQGGLDAPALHRIADRLGELHLSAPAGDETPFRARLAELARSAHQREELTRQLQTLANRVTGGRVRRLDDGRMPQDVLFDLAQVLVALVRRDLVVEANILANRYLDAAPQGASGWAALPLFVSLRAGETGDAELAQSILFPQSPRLVAIGGLSGTGKSTLARMLGNRMGRTPGARVLQSDVFRKRLAGLPPEGRLPPRHYSRHNDERTYEALFESAYDHLGCDNAVILDATFMSRSEREVAELLALRARVPFTGIWLDAPERDRVSRIASRGPDASDSTVELAREQSRHSVGELGGWHRVRVNRPLETIVPAVRGVIERTRR